MSLGLGQSLRSGVDTLIRGGERDTDVPCAGPAVERARRYQDAALGQPGNGVPARLVPRRPEVERGLRVVDSEPGRLERRPERRPAGGVARVLLLYVRVIIEGRDHGSLLGTGHHQSEVLADRQELPHHGGVSGGEPTPVAREVGPLGQRVHRQDPLEGAAVHVRVQYRDRPRTSLGLPGTLQVAVSYTHLTLPTIY